jgi:hypothetical protein
VDLLAIAAPPALPAPKVLDDFDDIGAWTLVLSDQVSGSLRPVSGAGGGRALCLDYDFHEVSGYVGIRRALNIDYPVNYRFGFQLRGDSPANDLQFKLIDASGDNVWWVNRPATASQGVDAGRVPPPPDRQGVGAVAREGDGAQRRGRVHDLQQGRWPRHGVLRQADPAGPAAAG